MKLTKQKLLIESLAITSSIVIGLTIAWVSGECFGETYLMSGLVYMIFFLVGIIISSRNSSPKENVGVIIPLILPLFLIFFIGFSLEGSQANPFFLALMVTIICIISLVGFVYLGFLMREQIKKLITNKLKIT